MIDTCVEEPLVQSGGFYSSYSLYSISKINRYKISSGAF